MRKIGFLILMIAFQSNGTPFDQITDSLISDRPLEGRSLGRFKAALSELDYDQLEAFSTAISQERKEIAKKKLYPLLNWDLFGTEALSREDLFSLGIYASIFSSEDPNYAYLFANSILETGGPADIAVRWFLKAARANDDDANNDLYTYGLCASLAEGITEAEIGEMPTFIERFMVAYRKNKRRVDELRGK